jgi:hypothetical protein
MLAFVGAMVLAGSGYLPFEDLGARMSQVITGVL